MKKFIIFAAWAIPVALLAWFAYTLMQNTKPQPQDKTQEICITVNFNNKPVEGTETVETTQQVPAVCPFNGETKTSEVKTVVKTTKSGPSERRVVITEDAFKETMQQVAYSSRQEAQNEYDKSFSTLLTILTIFGIAWPVIIAMLQFKFNESELNKIKQAQDDAQTAIKKADEAYNSNQKAFKVIQELSSLTKDAYNETLKRIQMLFDTNNVAFSSMALGNKDFSDYYYTLALRCTVWSIQTTKELGISKDTLKNMICNINLIKPQCKFHDLAKASYDMLLKIKIDLQNNIEANDEKLELLTLLDEKIAAYEKLLTRLPSNPQYS